jgi:hypothetical protein
MNTSLGWILVVLLGPLVLWMVVMVYKSLWDETKRLWSRK